MNNLTPVFDAKTQAIVNDSINFFTNNLEQFDNTLNSPLVDYTWSRDIEIRDIAIEMEITSFTRDAFGAVGTQSAQGKPWINAHTNAAPNVSVDREKVTTPFRNLGQDIAYTIMEMKRSTTDNSGPDILTSKINAFNVMYNMWTDEMVYVGDTGFSAEGLVNSSQIVAGPVALGLSGFTQWDTKTPDEILNDIQTLLSNVWENSAYASVPDTLLIPPAQYSYLLSTKTGPSSDNTILNFVLENNLSLQKNGRNLKILPLKWLKGAGAGGTDRMIAYTNEQRFVRFPMARPQRLVEAQWVGRSYVQPYDWGYGEVEFVYTETLEYADGI